MPLSYTPTLDDLVAFNVYHYWQSPARRCSLWRQLSAFMLLWAGYSLWILGVAAEMAGTGVASVFRTRTRARRYSASGMRTYPG